MNYRISTAPLFLLVGVLMQGCASILYVDDGSSFQSFDGKRTAKVEKGRVILDGVVQAEQYDGIDEQGVVFSADGKRVAYVGMRGTTSYPVIDGKQYGPFEGMSTSGITMSPKGTHASFMTVENNRWRLWDNGTPGPAVDGIAAMGAQFSADDSQLAYAAQRGDRWLVVANGVEYDAERGVSSQPWPIFNSRNEVVYPFTDGKGWAVRIGSWRSEMFEVIQAQSLVMSPDRGTVSYVVKKNNRWHACFNRVCGPAYDGIGSVGFVPPGMFDNFGKDLLVNAGLGVLGGLAGVTPHLIVSGPGAPKAVLLRYMIFSGDSRHHAYVGQENKRSHIVLDGTNVATLPDGAWLDSLRFSEDSSVLTYRVFGADRITAVHVPGRTTVPSTAVASSMQLSITSSPAQALVFIDGRFEGVAPFTADVMPGAHTIRVEKPGYITKEKRAIVDSASSKVAVELEMTPTHRALQSVLTPMASRSLLVHPGIPAGHYWKARGLCQVPLDQEVLAVVENSGGSCLVFGESEIFVHNEGSASGSRAPKSYRLSYADLRRSAVPRYHRTFYETTLVGQVVFTTSSSRMSREDLLSLLNKLRTALNDTAVAAAR